MSIIALEVFRVAHFSVEESMLGTSEDCREVGRLRTGMTGRKSKNRKRRWRDGSHREVLGLCNSTRIIVECGLGGRPDSIG